jgi:hypothetical protein
MVMAGLFLLNVGLQAQEVNKKEVRVQEKDGYKKITIKKHLEDGTLDVISWEGEGEVPEDIQKHLENSENMLFINEDGEQIQIIGGQDDKKEMKVIVRKRGDNAAGETIKIVGPDGQEIEKNVEVIIEGADEREIKNKVVTVQVDETGGSEEKEMKVEVIVVGEGEGQPRIIRKNGKEGMIFIKKADDGKVIRVRVNDEEGDASNEKMEWQAGELLKMERTLELQDFKIAPNPASQEINLSFRGEAAPLDIRIFDPSGRQLYKAYLRDFDGNFQDYIDIRDVEADLLFVTIEQNGKVYTEKVAVQ